jgi:very-short-patch-repair endonuclease
VRGGLRARATRNDLQRLRPDAATEPDWGAHLPTVRAPQKHTRTCNAPLATVALLREVHGHLVSASKLEATLAMHIKADRLPAPVRELQFHPRRKWRFDFAWPALMLAVEVDGGQYLGGRGHHYSPEGIAKDREKTIAADRLGWTVLHFTGKQVRSGQAIADIKAWLSESAPGSVPGQRRDI